MKKNILAIVLVVAVAVLAYQNFAISTTNAILKNDLSQLSEKAIKQQAALDDLQKEMAETKRALNIATKEAELMAAKAMEAGYRPSNVVRVKN